MRLESTTKYGGLPPRLIESLESRSHSRGFPHKVCYVTALKTGTVVMRDWYFLIGHKNDKACFYDLSKNIIHARKPLIVWHRLVVCLLLIVIIFIMGLCGYQGSIATKSRGNLHLDNHITT